VSTLAALWCPRRENDRVVAGAQARLYLTDPLLARLPSRLRAGLPAPDMTRGHHRFARTQSGNEVDLAPVRLPTESAATFSTPIESKWVDHGWRSDTRAIDGKYHHGVVATKSVLDTTDPVWAVPAPLLALLL
jgi:hypothetical protein